MNNQKKTSTSHQLKKLIVIFLVFQSTIFHYMASAAPILFETVTGIVTDENMQPLEGVTVKVKGSSTTAITNNNGRFSIMLNNKENTLIFSYIGYKETEYHVNGESNIQIKLFKSKTELNEVVVVGYGTRTKGDITGAVAKVDSKIFESRPLTNTLNALQGVIPGVTVVRGSGAPGREDYSFQIRGYSSLGGNKPLVLIDGVAGDLTMINPNDIANITVLKDAAASIYGARAADGVLLVTTKTGKSGVPVVSYSFNYAEKIPDFLKKMTTTLQLAEMENEGLTNVGQPGISQEVLNKIKSNAPPDSTGWMPYLQTYPGFYGNTDWLKLIYGHGHEQNHNISISGGGLSNTYLFSVGYTKNSGIFNYGKNESNRYNLRLNYDFNLFKRLKIETKTSFDNEIIDEPSQLYYTLRGMVWIWNYLPLKNTKDQYYDYQGYLNPANSLENGGLRKTNNSRFTTNVKAELKIIEGLKLVAQAGINFGFLADNANYRTFPRYNYYGGIEQMWSDPNSAYFTNSKNLYKSYTSYIDYTKTFSQFHHINLMVGASHEENDDEGQTTWGYNFVSNDIFSLSLADRTKVEYSNFTGNQSDWALSSYFGRASYNYSDKYIVDFTTRVDGSSKFSPTKRWSAVFPAVSAAWNLSNENFLKSSNLIDNLKIRGSWGQAGNQDIGFGNYDYIPLITITGNYPIGSPNAGLPGAIPSIASSERTWETIETKNIGVDFGLLNSRLSGSFDYYTKINKNMLVGVQVPATLGGIPPTQNSGRLVTKGWEASIGWKDKINSLRYSITLSLADNKNKLVELKGNDAYGEGLNYARQGYSIYSYFGYAYDGIIKTQKQLDDYKKLGGIPAGISLGDVMYKDVDGDGKISAFGDPAKGTKGDLVYLGSLLPRYTFSSNISLSYKNFDLGLFIQGVGKREGMVQGDFQAPLEEVWFQPLQYFYGKTWTPDRPNAQYPRIVPGGIGYDGLRNWDWAASSMRINNMAYARLKLITLGYNIPQNVIKRFKLNDLRVYVSGQDLFTISKGTWGHSFNPEELWQSSDERTYPFSKVISIGANIKF